MGQEEYFCKIQFLIKEKTIIHVQAKLLVILAAITWLCGTIVLLLKGSSLLIEAKTLTTSSLLPLSAGGLGCLLGIIKGISFFRKSCEKNIARIYTLSKPQLHQFFRPIFFFFLLSMIILGATLSRIAHGNTTMLLIVGGIDLSVGFALLTSFPVFFRKR